MRHVKLTLLAVTLVAATTLIVQNSEVVDFRLLFWTVSMSHIVLLLLTMALGFVSGYITSSFRRRRHREP
jgi:uncharacterized integral membrane protein